MSERRFTAQEMREEAELIGADVDAADMLRYAAGVVERCENELDATSCKDCVMSFNGQHCADYKGCGLHDFHNRFIRIIRGDAGKEETMASENETVAEIVRERKHLIEHWMWKPAIRNELRLLDRIEAAHGREIETMRIAACSAQARFDEELAAKNAEVAELRECLKEAVFVMQTLFDKQMPKWRKALKGAKYE